MKTTTTSPLRANQRKTLTFAMLGALCVASAFSIVDAAPVSGSPIAVARIARLGNGDAVTGALPMNHPMHVVVSLKLRNNDALDAFIAKSASDRSHGIMSPPMTRAQMLANHAPTQLQAQRVANYLTSMGFRNVTIASNRLLVSADGTAMTARNAFMTSFAQVKTADGRVAFANTESVRIPAALVDTVQAVLGLQTVHRLHTFARPLQTHSVHTDAITAHLPTEFPSIYGVGSASAASSVVVGIVTQGTMTQTKKDLATFFTKNPSLTAIVPSTVTVDGACTSSCTSGLDEWDLDSQDIIGMSGGVSQMIFYDIPDLFDSSITDDFNAIVNANVAKVVNVSLGGCETDAQGDGSVAAEDTILKLGVAQGQTFSISTGDSGADECKDGGITPSWPAASQWVVAAAGTTLNASATTWSSETVWSGSGGSPSNFETQPSWQAAFVPSGVTTRDVADIAYDADPNSGSKVYVNSTTHTTTIGGTSLSAPLFAGAWARMAQQYPTIGFAGPVIYQLPAAAFHDITSGNNSGETATTGYDSASGRGSMIVGTAITDASGMVNQAPVANFSFVVSGMGANFTDSSTEAGGAMANHAWNFGDGKFGSGATPSHTYTANGTYSVLEVVTDLVGKTSRKTEAVVVGGVNLLLNPGFETGTSAPWTIQPATVLTNNVSLAHAGSWFAALGTGTGTHTDRVSQAVTIPSGKTVSTLAFYLSTTTTETTTTAIHDHLDVQVYASDGTTLLATLASYSNLDTTSGYVAKSLDMTPYIGQTVRLKFVGVNNSTLPTSWDLDDVSLTAQ